MRIRWSLAVATTLALLTTLSTTSVASAVEARPPSIPSAATAKAELGTLTVSAGGSMTGYSRDRFPHWNNQGDGCDTRDLVLQRDGTGVSSTCPVSSGTWVSPYDGATWTATSDVDIDHVVPLAAAWRAGASAWTDDKRSQFANDLSGPQLITVTDNVNESKGDQTPDQWKPPLQSYWCTYARMWVRDKKNWQLTVTTAEKSALTSMLDGC